MGDQPKAATDDDRDNWRKDFANRGGWVATTVFPRMNARIDAEVERAERAEGILGFINMGADKVAARERVAELEAENTRLRNQARATRQQAINLADKLEQRKP